MFITDDVKVDDVNTTPSLLPATPIPSYTDSCTQWAAPAPGPDSTCSDEDRVNNPSTSASGGIFDTYTDLNFDTNTGLTNNNNAKTINTTDSCEWAAPAPGADSSDHWATPRTTRPGSPSPKPNLSRTVAINQTETINNTGQYHDAHANTIILTDVPIYFDYHNTDFCNAVLTIRKFIKFNNLHNYLRNYS